MVARPPRRAPHNERSEQLEQRGLLRQALEERAIALTIAPDDRKGQEAQRRLKARIARRTTGLLQEGRTLSDRGLLGEAQQRFLAALSLDPTNRTAFETLQNEVREVMFITHIVRPGDTCVSLAELYYGDGFAARSSPRRIALRSTHRSSRAEDPGSGNPGHSVSTCREPERAG